MRKMIMAGIWRLSKTLYESVQFFRDIRPHLMQVQNVEIVVFPCSVALRLEFETLKDTNIAVGAQNFYWVESGAYTWEVSASMVEEMAESVLIGHSERREYFGETNAIVNKKMKAALAYGMTPIVCVGDNLAQKELGLPIRGPVGSAVALRRIDRRPSCRRGCGLRANLGHRCG